MTLLQAILLGIVQGLTEFIPISSTAHLVLASRVMDLALSPEQLTSAIAVIQLGTLLAVIAYFAGDIWNITNAFVRDHFRLIKNGGRAMGGSRLSHEAWLGWLVIIGSLPVAVVGLAFKKQIEGTFTKNLWVIATMMVIIALLLAIAEAVGKRLRGMQDLGIKDALVVGFAQCLALIPGSSRSGSTIMAGLFAGETRETAARFSFLLSMPAIAASGLLELREALHRLPARQPDDAVRRHDRFGDRRLCFDLVSAAVFAHAHDRRVHRLSPAGRCGDSSDAIHRAIERIVTVSEPRAIASGS